MGRWRCPVREEGRLSSPNSAQQVPGATWLTTYSFVFPHGPSDEVFVDVSERLGQPGPVEAAVVAEPAAHDRVDRASEVVERVCAAQVQPPAFDLAANRLGGVVADGRAEAGEQATASV